MYGNIGDRTEACERYEQYKTSNSYTSYQDPQLKIKHSCISEWTNTDRFCERNVVGPIHLTVPEIFAMMRGKGGGMLIQVRINYGLHKIQ